MRADGQVLVLCSAGGVVQVTLDETGQPTGTRHLCPDLAPALVAGLLAAAPEMVRPATQATTVATVARLVPEVAARPGLRVRDPPVWF